MKKKVLVSGCFDLLHSGHVAFFNVAASFGDLYVCIGSDANIKLLKQQPAYFSQEERLYMVGNVKCVANARISSGSGVLDFEPDMRELRPDIFIVNEDGHTKEKAALCRDLHVEYKILKRLPAKNLSARSSSEIKKEKGFPYRICLAGGWVDQPWISRHHSGSVVVFQVSPSREFNDRSGMATSSRKIAMELWGNKLPAGDPIRNAHLLFGAENPPGTQYISGSQDHLGLLIPGISRLFYEGDYWPTTIETIVEKETCDWLSQVLHLIPLEPRPLGYNPLDHMNLNQDWIKTLGESGAQCWQSILKHDVDGLGHAMSQSFQMWQLILPTTVPDWVKNEAEKFASYPGLITSGSGGGYLMVASEKEIAGALKIKVNVAQENIF